MQEEIINYEQALELINSPKERLLEILCKTDKIRRDYKGNNIFTCAIVNAKSGNCGQDCAFCAQSVHAGKNAKITVYPLKTPMEILEAARNAKKAGASYFGIVTSGKAITSDREKAEILEAIGLIKKEGGIETCASLGIIDREFLYELKKAGLKRYHHNLETARSFYHNICTTRSYDDNRNTVMNAKEAELEICCGCLFGLGESNRQRVELLEDIKTIGVNSVPLNFFRPVSGAKIKHPVNPLTPLMCLKIIGIARLMMPNADIRICGGRQYHLRDLQSWIFAAGANALMIGNYLTTTGRNVAEDLQMIKDLGLICNHG